MRKIRKIKIQVKKNQEKVTKKEEILLKFKIKIKIKNNGDSSKEKILNIAKWAKINMTIA